MFRSGRYAAVLILLLGMGTFAFAEIRVSTEDALKAAVKKSPPDYPPMAKQLKVSGRVEVDVTIDAEGSVEAVKILSGNAMLTPSVVNAVKKWKFSPFTQGGSPTKAIAMLEFDFKM